MKKIWDKGTVINRAVEKFTVGNDMTYDMMMAEWDITATLAHARMLSSVGLIEHNEFISLADVLSSLFDALEKDQLDLPPD
jgi:argininosuccinate lyase